MKYSSLAAVCMILCLGLNACLPAEQPPLPATPTTASTATRVLTPTGTIVWFPATRTPTILPMLKNQPTADQRPGVGSLTLSDDFNQPGQWSSGKSAAGVVDAGDNGLSLSIPSESGMLLSLRSTTNVADFYLEITSNLSLCRGPDNYGVLVRAASQQDYYRFLISCDGKVRLERIINGRTSVLQDWTYSGQVPPGSPLILKLGVWAVGSQFRLFINDVYQFSAQDKALSNGSIGVFARSAGLTPVTVRFSDLKVYSVDPNAVPTITRTPSPAPTVTRTLAAPRRTPTPVFMRAASATPTP